MAMIHELENQGNWLFKRRGWLPLLMLIPVVLIIYFRKENNPVFNLTEELIFLGVTLAGELVRVLTVGFTPKNTSGRNIKGQIADELNKSGIYSILRHPLYFGNFLMWLGPILFVRSLWFTLITIILYWIYYERIMFAEEQFLRQKFGEEYDTWSMNVRAIIPGFRNFKPAKLPFSLRSVLKREYNSFASIFLLFAILDILRNYSLNQRLMITPLWLYLLLSGFIAWIIIRIFRKHTKMLDVKGR